jgi:type II secretory pathway component PulC
MCLGLAAVVYRELSSAETSIDSVSPVAKGTIQALRPEKSFAMAPIEKFSAIVERPIFSADRRPASKMAGSEKQAQRPRSKLTLYGIAISAGERIALVGAERGTGLIRVKRGDALSGWVVVDIERTRLLLRQGSRDEQLELNYGIPPPGK